MKTILPLTYLGSTEYFRCLYDGTCVIDLYEHYVKQSYRNRCDILTAGGPASLTVHVVKGGSIRKRPVCDMRIDYSKRWQHQHWGALVASYRSSPYFDFYAGRFEPFYRREWEFLADYNLGLLEVMCSLAKVPMPELSRTYVEAAPGDLDLRPKRKEGPAIVAEPYFQVFSERMPFVPNLSFADLLFAEGPASVSVLGRCRQG